MHITKRQFGISIVACIFGIGYTSPIGASENNNAIYQNKRAIPRGANISCVTKGHQTNRLSLERYKLLKQLARRGKQFPLWNSTFGYIKVLFPFRTSNRVYLLVHNGSWPPYYKDQNLIISYERTNAKVRYNYGVRLKKISKKKPNTAISHSLLDYIKSEGYAPYGRISNPIRRDLTTNRNYVQYTYIPYTDSLDVWLLSDGNELLNTTEYNLSVDPFTHAKLREGRTDKKGGIDIEVGQQEFFHKYGLPPAHGELPD